MPDRPKIVAERKRRAREMKPPQDFMLHEWGKPYPGIEVYITQHAFDKMMKQCAAYAKKHLEAMGYLVGDYCRWKNKEYTIVEDAVTSDLETTSVSVQFKAFEKAFDQLDKIDFDYVIVGWYHSHPGHGCFMSQTDISTQKRMFNKAFHVAIVIDPINKEFKAYKMNGNIVDEKVFGVYKNLDDEPMPGLEKSETKGPSEAFPAYGRTEPVQMYEAAPASQAIYKPEPHREETRHRRHRREAEYEDRAVEKKSAFGRLLLLLPLMFGAVGGILGFALSLNRDRAMAWTMLGLGLVMTAVWALLGPAIIG